MKREILFLGVVILVMISLISTGCALREKTTIPDSMPNNSAIDNSALSDEQILQKYDDGLDSALSDLDALGEPRIVELTVIAQQWEFIPNQIIVEKGDRVRLRIRSEDITHGFSLTDFNINEIINPGKEINVEFVADKAGEHQFYCTIPCGSGHFNMTGKLIVE